MVEAGVLHRQSGIGASLGRPVRVPKHKGISIMKIIVVVTAGLVAMLSVAAAATPAAAHPYDRYAGGCSVPKANRATLA